MKLDYNGEMSDITLKQEEIEDIEILIAIRPRDTGKHYNSFRVLLSPNDVNKLTIKTEKE